MLRVAVAVAAAASLGACAKAGAGAPGAKDVEAIKADETQWVADLKAKDVEKVVAHYSSAGVLMVPGDTPSHGTDQLRWGFKQAFADPSYSLSFQPQRVQVATAGDLAYSQGTFSLTVTDPTTHQPASSTGAYVTVYRKAANGSWKAIEQISTPTATAPAAPAAAPPPAKTANVEPSSEAEAVKAVEAQWSAAWKARDAARMASFFSADAVAMQPGQPAMAGAAAIQAGLAEALKQDPAFTVEFKADQAMVSASGDLAYTRGGFTETATDPKTHKPVERKGSYVTVFARQPDGAWKAVQDIASPGPQAVAASPAR